MGKRGPKPKNRRCSLDWCDRKHCAKGLCAPHYNQQWRGEELREVGEGRGPKPTNIGPCSIDGCERPKKCLGMCDRHYAKDYAKRNPEKIRAKNRKGRKPRRSIDERFFDRIEKRGECWMWMGSVTNSGYGQLHHAGTQGAHRVSHILFIGPIPPGYQVDHLCHEPLCVNPTHLEAVTPSVNQQRRRNSLT